jgi:hypothetical protein
MHYHGAEPALDFDEERNHGRAAGWDLDAVNLTAIADYEAPRIRRERVPRHKVAGVKGRKCGGIIQHITNEPPLPICVKVSDAKANSRAAARRVN